MEENEIKVATIRLVLIRSEMPLSKDKPDETFPIYESTLLRKKGEKQWRQKVQVKFNKTAGEQPTSDCAILVAKEDLSPRHEYGKDILWVRKYTTDTLTEADVKQRHTDKEKEYLDSLGF